MKNFYTLILTFFSVAVIYSQETFNFSGYNGTPISLTASSATVNDNITIVFEDVDIINNFYTQFQNEVYMYGGLDTDGGGWQGAPGFGDLGSQPQLPLDVADLDNNAAPNTYTLTINLSQHYTSVPDGTMVYGFNLLFQNQFGGGGNNQTVDLYIDLVDALKNSTLSTPDLESEANVFYANNMLSVNGYSGPANITAYDVFGRRLFVLNDVQVTPGYTQYMELPKQQLTFIVIEGNNFKRTLKIISN